VKQKQLKVKVCGLRDADNIKAISALDIDYAGFIFYPSSPRFAGNMEANNISVFGKSTKKIGVFVNEQLDMIVKTAGKYNLDGVQLHGNENADDLNCLRRKGLLTIKAFHVSCDFDFSECQAYANVCDCFLFDTKTAGYGASGKHFQWDMLNSYAGKTPFFLSGGIAPCDVPEIQKINHPAFYGIDLNSKFELLPGIKNTETLKIFLKTIGKL
jgi:phosphoribosylanthranilate isomerase